MTFRKILTCLFLFNIAISLHAMGEKVNTPVEYRQSNDLIVKDIDQIQSYLNNPSSIQTLFVPNAQIGPEPVRRIYLKISQQTLKQKPADLQKLLEFLHLQNKEVYFYLGAPQYAVEHGEPILIWDALLNYQKSNPGSTKFDGVFLDIRPYLLNDWKKNPSEIMKRYQSLIKTLKIQRIFTNEKFPIMITLHPNWIFQNPDTTDAYIYELMNYANAVAYDAGNFEFSEIQDSFKKTVEYLTQIKAPLALLLSLKTVNESSMNAAQGYYLFQKQSLMAQFQTDPIFDSVLIEDFQTPLSQSGRNQVTQAFKAALKTHPIDGNFDDWDFKIESIAAADGNVSANSSLALVHHNNNYLYLYFEVPANVSDLQLWLSPTQLENNPWGKSLYRFQIHFEKQSATTLQMIKRSGQSEPVTDSVLSDRIVGKARLLEVAIPKKYFSMNAGTVFPNEFLFEYRLTPGELAPFKTSVTLE